METRGFYYDGASSTRHEIALALEGDRLRLRGAGVDLCLPLSAVELSSPLGATRRSLFLPGGAKCEIEEGPFATRLSEAAGRGGFSRWVHGWEKSLRLTLVALVLTVAAVWGFIRFGIPYLAERAAFAIPPAGERRLGQETLDVLDKIVFRPTALPEKRREELLAVFAAAAADLDARRSYRLLFRTAPKMGANALALPGGTVVLTDELVKLAEDDGEIAAVLAHEIAHEKNRHALRQALQNSAAGLLIATLTGDILSTTSLAAALPTMLVNTSFSRRMEMEADAVAAGYLRRRGIPLERFAAILARLQTAHDRRTDSSDADSPLADYFSTHPATRERIEILRKRQIH